MEEEARCGGGGPLSLTNSSVTRQAILPAPFPLAGLRNGHRNTRQPSPSPGVATN